MFLTLLLICYRSNLHVIEKRNGKYESQSSIYASCSKQWILLPSQKGTLKSYKIVLQQKDKKD